jgi:hypothetical protein
MDRVFRKTVGATRVGATRVLPEGWPKVLLKSAMVWAMLTPMMTPTKTPVNQEKVSQLRAALAEILAETLQRGFHGTAGIEVNIQDGTIQTIRHRVERIRR